MKLLIAVLAALMLAGCGGPDKLSENQHLEVVSAEFAIMAAPCEEDLLYADAADEDRLLDAVDLLVKLYRVNPDALAYYGKGGDKTVRQVLTDAANTLDDCNPDLARDIDRELANGG